MTHDVLWSVWGVQKLIFLLGNENLKWVKRKCQNETNVIYSRVIEKHALVSLYSVNSTVSIMLSSQDTKHFSDKTTNGMYEERLK